MVKHVVMWKLKERAEGEGREANALKIKEALAELFKKVPGVRSWDVGIDFGRTDASFDVVLVSEFDNEAALAAYQKHPEHVKVAEFIGRLRDVRAIVDYSN
jgi:hypothetical protein